MPQDSEDQIMDRESYKEDMYKKLEEQAFYTRQTIIKERKVIKLNNFYSLYINLKIYKSHYIDPETDIPYLFFKLLIDCFEPDVIRSELKEAWNQINWEAERGISHVPHGLLNFFRYGIKVLAVKESVREALPEFDSYTKTLEMLLNIEKP